MTSDLFDAITAGTGPHDQKIWTLASVARDLCELIASGQPVNRHRLTRLMTSHFGAGDATGAWSLREGFDALETAQALALRHVHCAEPSGDDRWRQRAARDPDRRNGCCTTDVGPCEQRASPRNSRFPRCATGLAEVDRLFRRDHRLQDEAARAHRLCRGHPRPDHAHGRAMEPACRLRHRRPVRRLEGKGGRAAAKRGWKLRWIAKSPTFGGFHERTISCLAPAGATLSR